MASSERRTTGASTCAAAALVAALGLTAGTVPASGGERAAPSSRKPEPVGHVTWITGDVTIGRTPVGRKAAPLRAGDFLATGPSSEAKLDLKLKGMSCTVLSKTQLRVRPSKHVGYQIVGGAGDVDCVTSSRSREKVVVKARQLAISMKDPLFSVSVRQRRAVVKVRRGSVILTGPTGIRRGVVVARNQQSVVPTGRDPREPQPIKLTSRERAAFVKLERMLPKLRDTTPPKTRILNGPRTPTKNLSATFAFRANETPVNYSCSVDRTVFRVCSSPTTYPALPPGSHTFAVRATDAEGNVGKPAPYTWRVIWKPAGEQSFTRQVIARSATDVQLEVDAQDRALVTYKTGGQVKSVLAWGAVNALPPTEGGTQVRFNLLYGVLEIRDVCGPYRGPPLAWQVVACTAPDGTHWATQQWQRGLPNYGKPPTPEQAAPELRLSHWSGPLAQLTIKTDWANWPSTGIFDHLYGSLTYRGQPVHGFRSTPRGVPLDPFGRNIFVDTLGSVYGPGWQRENSFLTHRPTGTFCYGFYRHPALQGPVGKGSRYRATVIGPGVTPDVYWEGPAPGPYDPALNEAANVEQRQLFAQDKQCLNKIR